MVFLRGRVGASARPCHFCLSRQTGSADVITVITPAPTLSGLAAECSQRLTETFRIRPMEPQHPRSRWRLVAPVERDQFELVPPGVPTGSSCPNRDFCRGRQMKIFSLLKTTRGAGFGKPKSGRPHFETSLCPIFSSGGSDPIRSPLGGCSTFPVVFVQVVPITPD